MAWLRSIALRTALPIFLAASPALPATAGGVAGELFADGFESGDTAAWSATVSPGPPNCNCYFSADCPGGSFCTWGPGGPAVEDICNWRLPKPGGIPGAGCTSDASSPGPICDGLCLAGGAGLPLGREGPPLLAEGIRRWAEALLGPSEAGGGPVDRKQVDSALELPFASPLTAWLLGRHTADLLTLASDPGFADYFCHFETGHEEPAFYVDLAADRCRRQAGRLAVEGLIHELLEPGSGHGYLAAIPAYCPEWQLLFGPRCRPGPGTLDCLTARVEETARYLTSRLLVEAEPP